MKLPSEIYRSLPHVINKVVGRTVIEAEPLDKVVEDFVESISPEDLHKLRSMLSPEQRKVVDEIWERIKNKQ